jgi:toxin ParE1/3/4
VNLVILPDALAELGDAAAFYAASANAELGLALVDEFEHAVNVILGNPKIGAVFRGDRRRYLLRRFPYSVIYQLIDNDIRIIAVAHQRRPAKLLCTPQMIQLPLHDATARQAERALACSRAVYRGRLMPLSALAFRPANQPQSPC